MSVTIKDLRLSVAIHNLDADPEAVNFLLGWIREVTKAGLTLSRYRDRLGFHGWHDDDIVVKVEEQQVGAGE